MQTKTKQSSGADEKTPSIPQYFSWINNTNEGATEEQTLKNLEYFKWLYDTYGMKLKIYAWDAGNLDGAGGTYENPLESKKLKKQYPNGYRPLSEKAAEFGCHLGVWGGADGFGDTEESEKKRYDLMVGLCKDLGFMEFKFDTVCGALRAEKRDTFKKMIDECRKYVPELIVLNHRNDLGDAEICATTFLWGGQETYIEVHMRNNVTGSHHRVCTLERGLVPDMLRLTEDHGVCISSCPDYFEDDLINQAFARSLILSPELYGNPWFLRDSEEAHLARIYNWHEKYNDILVNGIALPEKFGKSAVSRGDGKTRLVVLNNATWNKKEIALPIDETLGLDGKKDKYIVKTLHPYESYVGTYEFGREAKITVEPFRAALILIQEEELFKATDFVLTGAEYETVSGKNAVPDKALIFSSNGKIGSIGNKNINIDGMVGDETVKAPIFLGKGEKIAVPENSVQLYEATAFRADTDSLEDQAIRRSGETSIPQVKAARDAFFAQDTYKFRGTKASYMFDGKPDTYFDALSKYYGIRYDGGCLRVDFGKTSDVSKVEIECFEINEPIYEVHEQSFTEKGDYSDDLRNWTVAPLSEKSVVCETKAPVIIHSVHNIVYKDGKRVKAVYKIGGKMRYFRLPCPMDRIYSVKIFDISGNEIKVENAFANNILSPNQTFNFAKAVTVHVPENAAEGSYIAAANDGLHGVENVYCAVMCDGKAIGFEDRAASYRVNQWEHLVGTSDSGYTYYLNVTPELKGKDITVYALYREQCDTELNIWLCDGNNKKPIGEIKL